jgi:hypothetical protein
LAAGDSALATDLLGSSGEGLAMSEVTQILDAIGQGDQGAAAQLLPLLYAELRRLAAAYLAREAPG